MTTYASVQASVDQLSRARTELLVQDRGFVSPITGDMDPLAAPSQAHTFADVGSASLGVRGRFTSDSGLMVLGGLLTGYEDYQNVRAGEDLTGTLALRFAPTSMGPSRPFIEVGGLLGRTNDLTFTRTYANGVGTAVGQGSTTASTSAIWGRAGWIFNATPADQLGVFAEYGYDRQSIGGYAEPLSKRDPFNAVVLAGADALDAGKIAVRYDHTSSAGWDFGVGLAVAHAFDESQGLQVAIPGFGFVPADPTGRQSWLEYGGHVGYAFNRHSALSLFVTGIAGPETVGSAAHFGLDYRLTF